MQRGKFIVCKASAGAGKTFTLVKTFITLSLEAKSDEALTTRFRKILAITFTNKAANEMKERILKSLKNIHEQGTANKMGEIIQKESGMEEAEMKRRCGIVHTAILHNYSDLSVCTIDSFMQRVVRTFAHDLNLPVNFDVMIDNSNLIQEAVDELMGLVGTEGEEDLTKILCTFAEAQMEEGKSYNIEKSITKLTEQLFEEDVPERLQQLDKMTLSDFKEIYNELKKKNNDFEKLLIDIGEKARQLYTGRGIDVENFANGKNGIPSYFKKLEQKKFEEPGANTLKFIEGGKISSTKCDAPTLEALTEIAPELRTLFSRAEELRRAGIVAYTTRRMLMQNLYTLALLNKLQELVKQCSNENEIVHISEFNKSIAKVVNEEPAPYIYERLGSRYTNYLIDEFQDTSKLQWQNLVPLVENGVSTGATSLIVGDGKQAIYRFRQGDVRQFVRLPLVDNKMHGQIFSQPGIAEMLQLQDNQRSGETIVRFNNDFFVWAVQNCYPDNEELRLAYLGKDPERKELEQNPKHKGGYVELGFWEGIEAKANISNQLAQTIHHLVEDCGYHYSDIMLMGRDNLLLSTMAEYLISEPAGKIPLVSSESFLLSRSKIVMMTRCLMDYLVDPQNRLAAAQVYSYLKALGKVSHSLDLHFVEKEGGDLEKALEQEGITLNIGKLRSLSLYDCVEEMLRELGLEGYESAYVSALLNTIASYSKSHRQSISEFTEWFDQQKSHLSAKSTSSSDAVVLTTVHKAKGLSAKIILYPIMVPKSHKKKLWVEVDAEKYRLPVGIVTPSQKEESSFSEQFKQEELKEELDDLNLLYVALTRPEEKIYVYCESSAAKSDNYYATLLHQYLDSGHGESTKFTAIDGRNGECYALGSESEATNDEEKPTTNEQVERIVFNDWSDRIVIAESRHNTLGNKQQESIARGIAMHDILSRIRYPEDVSAAVEQYSEEHGMAEEEKETLVTQLQQLIAQPSWAPYFDHANDIKTECNIYHQDKILRPDRIVIAPNCTWVVDFKTGAEHEEYQIQIERYCEAIRALGYSEIKGVLLYL